jgi:hypothetical protein
MQTTKCIEKQSLKNWLEAHAMVETVEKQHGWVMVDGERTEELDTLVSPTAKVLVVPELKVGC